MIRKACLATGSFRAGRRCGRKPRASVEGSETSCMGKERTRAARIDELSSGGVAGFHGPITNVVAQNLPVDGFQRASGSPE